MVRGTASSFETEAPGPDEIRKRPERTLRSYPWLVYERDGLVVGYSYAGPFHERAAYRWCVEITLYVHEGFRGEGVGRALLERLLQLLGHQGFTSAVGIIALPNAPSTTLLESLGFEHVGTHREVGYKLGRWHDVGRWERSLSERPAKPAPPIPFDTLDRNLRGSRRIGE